MDCSPDGCPSGKAHKPVILLYSKQPTDFTVSVSVPSTKSIVVLPNAPVEIDSSKCSSTFKWKGSSKGEGSLLMMEGGKFAPYLFYEYEYSANNAAFNKSKPIYVIETANRSESLEKLITVLMKLGLNEKEAYDMSTFWVRDFTKRFIKLQFLIDEECEKIAKLEIQPKPTETKRVFMIFENSDEALIENYNEVAGSVIKRTDFCVIEWGGSQIL